MTVICEGCRWFVALTPTKGECRRYPPVLLSLTQAKFPEVENGKWCGEWQQRPEETP